MFDSILDSEYGLYVIFWFVNVYIDFKCVEITDVKLDKNVVTLFFQLDQQKHVIYHKLREIHKNLEPKILRITFEGTKSHCEFNFNKFSTKSLSSDEIAYFENVFNTSSLLKSQKYINSSDIWTTELTR